MKHKIFLLVVFAGLSMVFTMVAVLGQQRIDKVSAESFSNLTLRIALTKRDFLPYEPIPLNLLLSNETSVPVIGHSELGFDDNYIKLLVTNENGEAIEVSDLSPMKCKCEKPKNIQILPSQKFQKSGFFYNFPKAFLTAGAYQLQAVFQDAKKQSEIKSEPVTIRITEPTGADVEAYNFLKNKMEKNGFLFSGMANEEIFNDLATRFTGTLYGDYGAVIISGKYLARGDYDKVESLLRSASQREDFAFKESVLKTLNRVNELRRANKQQ